MGFLVKKMDPALPKELATEILSDSDHSTKVAPTTLSGSEVRKAFKVLAFPGRRPSKVFVGAWKASWKAFREGVPGRHSLLRNEERTGFLFKISNSHFAPRAGASNCATFENRTVSVSFSVLSHALSSRERVRDRVSSLLLDTTESITARFCRTHN